MEYEAVGVGVVATIIIVVIIMVVRLRRVNAEEGRRRAMRKVAPGPRWWPVVGNIFQVGWSHHPHESLAKLARNHGGGIMTLWLGCMCTVVVSSTEVAQDMFRNHDLVLAGRKLYDSMRGRGGSTNEGSLITSHYGPHWRMLRRLSTTQFFLTSRLDAMRAPRRKCIDRMLRRLMIQAQRGGDGVELGRLFFLMNFNLIGNLIFSKELLLHDDEEEEEEIDERGARFYYHAVKVMEYAGKPNLADFVPLLRWLDPQGIRSKTQYHVERAFDIAGLFISERIQNNNIGIGIGIGIGGKTNNNGNANSSQKDFLDVLLEFRGDAATGPYTFSPRTINVVIFEMFTAGTDTTTSTMEWAMAELLHNPRALKRAQMEVRSKVEGRNHLEEKDVDDLPYLKAVIKETLRLHPPLPFLVPHMAMDSCTMQGYHIPKDSQILVNVWAIARDPKLWDAPLLFWPERFLDPDTTTLDFKGHHFQFIPFGSGRRMCPAMPLAARVLPLALGSLLHKFDWVLPHGLKPEEMDMTEGMGITLRKAVPLKAIPLPYTPPHGG